MCGSLGCEGTGGQESHHYTHFVKVIKGLLKSKHVYAMKIENKLVFNHLKQQYVHRMLQNVVDGKIMESDSTINRFRFFI